jgi:hypothetical protein
MAANYATSAFTSQLASGAAYSIQPGATLDTVTDSAKIALWSTNFTATAPVAGVGNVTGVMAGYLAAYPRGA